MDVTAKMQKNLISSLAKKGTRMVPEMRSGSNGLILYGEDSPILKVIFIHLFYCIDHLYQGMNRQLAEKNSNTVVMLKSVDEIKSALHHAPRELYLL